MTWAKVLTTDIVIKEANSPKESLRSLGISTCPRLGLSKSKKKQSKKLSTRASQAESIFKSKLKSEDPDGTCMFAAIIGRPSQTQLSLFPDDDFFAYAKMLTPAAIDLELRSLSTTEEFTVLLNSLTRRLRSHRDFEAVQTFLGVFLNIHGEVMINNFEVRDALQTMLNTQKEETKDIMELITSSLGVLRFLRGVS